MLDIFEHTIHFEPLSSSGLQISHWPKSSSCEIPPLLVKETEKLHEKYVSIGKAEDLQVVILSTTVGKMYKRHTNRKTVLYVLVNEYV